MQLSLEPARFATAIDNRPATTLGLHLDLQQVQRLGNASFERILAALDPHVFNFTTRGSGVVKALPLLDPIDPWFQGSARALVLEARALELLAVAESWLVGSRRVERPPRNAARAELAREYIEANLATSLSLDTIARAVGINVRTLTAAFRERFGMSIAAYLTQRRMQAAQQLLAAGASVSQTAYAVGYQPNALSTAFRRHFGYPPTAMMRDNDQGTHLPSDEAKTPTHEE